MEQEQPPNQLNLRRQGEDSTVVEETDLEDGGEEVRWGKGWRDLLGDRVAILFRLTSKESMAPVKLPKRSRATTAKAAT
jgi:hypothetical protein